MVCTSQQAFPGVETVVCDAYIWPRRLEGVPATPQQISTENAAADTERWQIPGYEPSLG